MLRRAIRSVVRRTNNWLYGDHKFSTPVPSSAYDHRLNPLFHDLLRDEPDLRPHFIWGVACAADLAKNLGIKRISAIEFGVAGGKGLISLERTAMAIERQLGVAIDVYGFDTGQGLPKPSDYRDLPNLYQESDFKMEPEVLKNSLRKANLILGPVHETVPTFVASGPAPVGFISVDVDYYSSTMDAFQLFEGKASMLLPRVHCYFDDMIGFTFSEFTGERLAIADFNGSHPMRKISPIFGLRYYVPPPYNHWPWVEQMYLAHIFDHEQYSEFDGMLVKAAAEASTQLRNVPLGRRSAPVR